MREAGGGRSSRPDHYLPAWSEVLGIIAKTEQAVVKLAPAAKFDAADVPESHRCWLSLGFVVLVDYQTRQLHQVLVLPPLDLFYKDISPSLGKRTSVVPESCNVQTPYLFSNRFHIPSNGRLNKV